MSIRVRLEMSALGRDLALFNLAIDSKLRAASRLKASVPALSFAIAGYHPAQDRSTRPVEITAVIRQSIERLVAVQSLSSGYLFRSRVRPITRNSDQYLASHQLAPLRRAIEPTSIRRQEKRTAPISES
jgi:hypothetical protein